MERWERAPKVKVKPNASILDFVKKKPAAVPSLAAPAPLITNTPFPRLESQPRTEERTHPMSPLLAPSAYDVPLLTRLQDLILRLPGSVPEATENDHLAVFGQDPRHFDDPEADGEGLWEEVINRVLKDALSWGMEREMSTIIRRGRNGMGGLHAFVEYFVRQRGVDPALFEGKLERLMKEMERM